MLTSYLLMKDLLVSDIMNRRAELSEKAITEGRTKKFDKFNEDYEQWKIQKRANMK